MGRSKGYERDTLVAKAMEVFHRLGYKGASTQVLVEELGVNRNSVYSEFGNKERLFNAALEHYDKHVVSHVFGALESADANLNDIENLFRTFIENAGAAKGLGCLMCNTAAELGGYEPTLQPRIDRHFDRLSNAFHNALSGAIRSGQVSPDIDTIAEARFMVASSIGLSILVRGDISNSAAQVAAQGALSHLALLRHMPQ